MSQVEIRQVSGLELSEMSALLRGYAFSATPPLPAPEKMTSGLDTPIDDIQLGLFEDGSPVAIAAFAPFTQHVRGKIFLSGGIGGVAVHPAGRRKGYARQVLLALLETMRQQEMAFSILYPFRESFYGRLGYTTFPYSRQAQFEINSLTGLLKQDLGGKVEMFPLAEGFSEWRDYLKKQQVRQPGMALRSDRDANALQKNEPSWLAIARSNGETLGTMVYRIQGDHGDLQVSHFYYENSRGLYLLLEWIARHADQATTAELKLAPDELPETWLPDSSPKIGTFGPPMARVLDIGRISGLESGPGEFSARIIDPQCPWNEGAYTFEAVAGLLQVRPIANGQADCDLTIQGLSGLIFGTHRPDSFELRDWGNPSPATQATMLRMFPPQLPHLHEGF